MTDPGRIKVTPEVAAAASHIRERAVALDGVLDELRPEVAALPGTWQGEQASANYQRFQAQWDGAAEELWGRDGTTGLLPGIANTAAVIARNYSDNEVTIARGWDHG